MNVGRIEDSEFPEFGELHQQNVLQLKNLLGDFGDHLFEEEFDENNNKSKIGDKEEHYKNESGDFAINFLAPIDRID